MQAIITKYLPGTNTQGQRVKASCARGSLIVSCGQIDEDLYHSRLKIPHGWSESNVQHVAAAQMLVNRFAAEDLKSYGTPKKANPWQRRRVVGQLPSGDYAHVFVQKGGAK